MSSLKTFLQVVQGTATGAKDWAVQKILEDYLFPWYEAKTGKATNKAMRRAIALKVEESLSSTLWISKAEYLELDEEGYLEDSSTPGKFVVNQVFPVSGDNGSYELKVAVYQRTAPSNSHVLTLETFLRDFAPYQELDFTEFDS